MYYGEVQVYQEDLANFLAIAEELKPKGLAGVETIDENKDPKNLRQVSNHYNTYDGNQKIKWQNWGWCCANYDEKREGTMSVVS